MCLKVEDAFLSVASEATKVVGAILPSSLMRLNVVIDFEFGVPEFHELPFHPPGRKNLCVIVSVRPEIDGLTPISKVPFTPLIIPGFVYST